MKNGMFPYLVAFWISGFIFGWCSKRCFGEAYNPPKLKGYREIQVVRTPQVEHQFGEFTPYVREFEQLYTKYNHAQIPLRDLNFYIGEVDNGGMWSGGFDPDVVIRGHCSSNTTSVGVQTGFWNTGSAMDKKLTIFHELGHCLCYLEHQEVGIMKAMGKDPHALEPEYLKYFFESCKNSLDRRDL